MTPEELDTTIAERDNEIATLARHEAECCEQVRLFADARRQAAAKRKSIEVATQPLRDAKAAHVAEQRRLHAEKAKAEAEAKAKAAAEAKAAIAADVKETLAAEIHKRDAEIAALKEQLAAKG